MSLTKVEVTAEVFWTCCNHALSTEAEEIMGLLLGDVNERSNGEVIARIWIAMPQIRSDRRKDRVEASPEQLSRCAAAAEQFTSQGGVRTRVIGWYHSHPHITVLPSHVDIKTQATYQMLDDGFVGLIFSTFNQDPKDKSQSISVTAFQSVAANEGLSPSPSFMAGRLPSMDADMAQAIQLSLAEARHQASADSVQWQRKGVPLRIVQSKGPMERTLTDLVALAKVLYQEEQKAFHAAMAEATDRDGNIDPLAAIQHATMYQQNLARLMELVVAPMLRSMHTTVSQQQLKKQCGHLANSVYSMPLPSQAGTPESQTLAQLSASMAELLESPPPDVGKAGLAPQQSGVSSMGAESWDPSEALQLHQTQQQQSHQQQQQVQQQQMQPQGLVLPDLPPVFQMPEQQQMPQSPFRAHAASQHQVDSQIAAPQQVAQNAFSNTTGQGYFSQPGYHQLDQTPAPQAVNVSIISPAIWAPADRQAAQPSQASERWQGSQQRLSAPLATSGELSTAHPASSFVPGSEYHAPDVLQHGSPHEVSQQQQQPQQQQLFFDRPAQLSPLPPLASRDSRRSIATNTQLTMHRGSPDLQKPSGAVAQPDSVVPLGSASQASSLTGSTGQDSGLYASASSNAGLASPVGSGNAFVQQQPMLHASNSTGNLSTTSSLDGLERRASGQLPMRAGSPALGGRTFPKPPSWSSRDPFGDLVTSDMKTMHRTDSNASR